MSALPWFYDESPERKVWYNQQFEVWAFDGYVFVLHCVEGKLRKFYMQESRPPQGKNELRILVKYCKTKGHPFPRHLEDDLYRMLQDVGTYDPKWWRCIERKDYPLPKPPPKPRKQQLRSQTRCMPNEILQQWEQKHGIENPKFRDNGLQVAKKLASMFERTANAAGPVKEYTRDEIRQLEASLRQ